MNSHRHLCNSIPLIVFNSWIFINWLLLSLASSPQYLQMQGKFFNHETGTPITNGPWGSIMLLLFLCHSHHLLTQALYRVKENQREKDLVVTRTRVFELSKRKFKEVRLLYLPIPNFPRFQHGVGLKIYEHAKFGWHKVIGSPALCWFVRSLKQLKAHESTHGTITFLTLLVMTLNKCFQKPVFD